MEGIKGLGGGGGRVGVGEEDMGDGMQCSDHPYRNNPGGICAFCLQEKLGKLVSSSLPPPIRGSSSSSPSPSFRSDGNGGARSSSSLSLSIRPSSTKVINDGGSKDGHHHEYYTRRARIPFLLARKKKKKKKLTTVASSARAGDIVFKRSKSTKTPRRNQFLDADDGEDFSPRKRGGFWSFLYFSSSSPSSTSSSYSKPGASKGMDKSFRDNSKITTLTAAVATNGSVGKQNETCPGSSLGKKSDIGEDDDSPNSQATASASSFERKVSRSRSVGCGSRSFSGDFFERISTGFGDCTLRRVESHREGKPKVSASAVHRGGAGGDHHNCMKERVTCGGIFGGFMVTSSSSSSSSSSYWVSSSAEDMNGKPARPLAHDRSKSWGWAYASPMRAFSKPSSKDGKRNIIREASDKNTTPNLAAMPSLLAVRG